jgi:hypothetical protein
LAGKAIPGNLSSLAARFGGASKARAGCLIRQTEYGAVMSIRAVKSDLTRTHMPEPRDFGIGHAEKRGPWLDAK